MSMITSHLVLAPRGTRAPYTLSRSRAARPSGLIGWVLIALAIVLAPGLLRAQNGVVISEFLAHNTSGLLDEDGEASDWIEIYNGGASSVNLGGWYLTDESTNLTKWGFPSTNLPAKAFLIVFASGKNRAVPGLPLHTSFNLSSTGEFLALVMPDGVTIATQFAPAYPEQFADVSYGFQQNVAVTYFVTNSSPARVLIPTGPVSPLWTSNGFNDLSWLSGTNGVGY